MKLAILVFCVTLCSTQAFFWWPVRYRFYYNVAKVAPAPLPPPPPPTQYVYVKQAVPVVSVPAVPALSFRANWSYQPWVPTFHTANVAVQASKTKGFAASADAVGVVEHDAKTDDDGFDDAK